MNTVTQIYLDSELNEGCVSKFVLDKGIKRVKSITGLLGDVKFKGTLDSLRKKMYIVTNTRARYKQQGTSLDDPMEYVLNVGYGPYFEIDFSNHLNKELSPLNIVSIINDVIVSESLGHFFCASKNPYDEHNQLDSYVDVFLPKFFFNEYTGCMMCKWYRISLDKELFYSEDVRKDFDSRHNSLRSFPTLICIYENLTFEMNDCQIRQIAENISGTGRKVYVSEYISDKITNGSNFGIIASDDLYRILGMDTPFKEQYTPPNTWYTNRFYQRNTTELYLFTGFGSDQALTPIIANFKGGIYFTPFDTVKSRNVIDNPYDIVGTEKGALCEGVGYDLTASLVFEHPVRMNHGIDYLFIGLKNLNLQEHKRFYTNIKELIEQKIFLVVDVRQKTYPKETYQTSLAVNTVDIGKRASLSTIELVYYAYSGYFGGFREVNPSSVKIKIKPVFMN